MANALETRKKVIAALERGESAASIARRLEIGERSVYRYQERVRKGQPLAAEKPGPKGPIKLTAEDQQVLRDLVAQRPGVTAKEAIPHLSVRVAQTTVCRAWRRLGLSRKKSR